MKSSFETPAAQTMIALYLELDAIAWYYKFIASIANWAMLAGFIVFPNAFNDDESKFKLEASTLRTIAVCLLAFGYLLTGMLCWRFRNLLFQVELIFMPGFSSSTIGLVGSLFSVYGKVYGPDDEQWSPSAITAVTISSVFMVLYGATSLNANRKLDAIRNLDECKRQIALSQEDENLLPEEERTRRNLLGLLLSPQNQQQLSSQQHQYQRGFGNTPSVPPIPTAAASQTSFTTTSYPPVTPVSMVGGGMSPDSSIYLTTYGGQIGYPGDPNRGDSPDGGKPETTNSRWTYSVLRGGYGRGGYIDRDREAQQGTIGRRNSIFAGISATVGRGRERIGAGWNSWGQV